MEITKELVNNVAAVAVLVIMLAAGGYLLKFMRDMGAGLSAFGASLTDGLRPFVENFLANQARQTQAIENLCKTISEQKLDDEYSHREILLNLKIMHRDLKLLKTCPDMEDEA